MGKQRKKLRCICRGKSDRVHPGTDNQKHIIACPLVFRRDQR